MSFVAILGLFLFKHGLLTHVVDFGYSYSRSVGRRFWFLGLMTHCMTELTVSALIMRCHGWTLLPWVLSLELLALVTSSWVERKAPLPRLLRTHIGCELAVLAVYALNAGLLVSA